MPYTLEDFDRMYNEKHFKRLTPEVRRRVLPSLPAEERLAGLPAEERLAGLSEEQIRQYLERLTAGRPAEPRKRRGKK